MTAVMATVAEQLRQARQAAGLSLHQIAETTKMRTDHVAALEEGNYDTFVAPVYIRGFVRTYARLLHLDEAAVMTALDAELGQTSKFREPPSLGGGADGGALDAAMLRFSRINWRIALPAIMIVVVLLAVIVVGRAVRHRQAADPLGGITPGLYQPATTPAGETLPLPSTNAPARH
jgi:cytoskeletal protein RodZ